MRLLVVWWWRDVVMGNDCSSQKSIPDYHGMIDDARIPMGRRPTD